MMNNESVVRMSDEDWFNLGKADAWAGQPKQPPTHDSQAASLYDLGYGEGEIKHSPTDSSNPLNLAGDDTEI